MPFAMDTVVQPSWYIFMVTAFCWLCVMILCTLQVIWPDREPVSQPPVCSVFAYSKQILVQYMFAFPFGTGLPLNCYDQVLAANLATPSCWFCAETLSLNRETWFLGSEAAWPVALAKQHCCQGTCGKIEGACTTSGQDNPPTGAGRCPGKRHVYWLLGRLRQV